LDESVKSATPNGLPSSLTAVRSQKLAYSGPPVLPLTNATRCSNAGLPAVRARERPTPSSPASGVIRMRSYERAAIFSRASRPFLAVSTSYPPAQSICHDCRTSGSSSTTRIANAGRHRTVLCSWAFARASGQEQPSARPCGTVEKPDAYCDLPSVCSRWSLMVPSGTDRRLSHLALGTEVAFQSPGARQDPGISPTSPSGIPRPDHRGSRQAKFPKETENCSHRPAWPVP